MRNPVEILAEIFGTQAAVAREFDVLPSTVSNWKVLGVPDAQKWVIAKRLRRLRDARQISDAAFLEAIEALEREDAPTPALCDQ